MPNHWIAQEIPHAPRFIVTSRTWWKKFFRVWSNRGDRNSSPIVAMRCLHTFCADAGHFIGVTDDCCTFYSSLRYFETPDCHDRWMMLAGKLVHHAMHPELRGSAILATQSLFNVSSNVTHLHISSSAKSTSLSSSSERQRFLDLCFRQVLSLSRHMCTCQ
jgi:hypothetical protein